MSQPDYILFYSNKCLHSKELLNILYKDVDLNQKFTKVNIDNTNVKIPSYVKAVPTVVYGTNGKLDLMVGSAIFKWINQRKQSMQQQQQQGILDWDPHTMSGFSDGFSYLENKNDVIKRSFAFINENNAISTPDIDSYQAGSGNSSMKSEKEKRFDGEYEKFMSQRKNDIPMAPPRLG